MTKRIIKVLALTTVSMQANFTPQEDQKLADLLKEKLPAESKKILTEAEKDCNCNALDRVLTLLAANPDWDINHRDQNGDPVAMRVLSCPKEVIDVAVKHGAGLAGLKDYKKYVAALHQAIKDNDDKKVEALFKLDGKKRISRGDLSDKVIKDLLATKNWNVIKAFSDRELIRKSDLTYDLLDALSKVDVDLCVRLTKQCDVDSGYAMGWVIHAIEEQNISLLTVFSKRFGRDAEFFSELNIANKLVNDAKDKLKEFDKRCGGVTKPAELMAMRAGLVKDLALKEEVVAILFKF